MVDEKKAQVAIVMGSKSDRESAAKVAVMLERFEISWRSWIASCHRTPQLVNLVVDEIYQAECKVVIAIGGMSFALPGVMAAICHLPIIAVPLSGGGGGLAALAPVTNLPTGTGILTPGLDQMKNAALAAARIVALVDSTVTTQLQVYRRELAEETQAANKKADQLIREEMGKGGN